MTAWAPLLAVVVAAAQLARVVLHRARWSDGTVLLCAFVAWAAVPALVVAASNRTTGWTLSTRVLDLVITAALIVWALTADVTPTGLRVATIIVIVASFIAFGDEWLPSAVEHHYFLLLFLAPVIWRFMVDTSDLHEGSGRKLVVASVVWGLLLVVSALAAADTSLFDEANWDLAGRFEWRLLMVPLCFTFVMMISRTDRPSGNTDSHDEGASFVRTGGFGSTRASGATEDGVAADENPRRWIPAVVAAVGALVALALLAGALVTVAGTDAEAVARPDLRVDVTLQDGALPACAWVNEKGEGILLVLGQVVVIAEHIPESVKSGNPEACKDAVDLIDFVAGSGACSTPLPPTSTHVSVAGMTGGELIDGGTRIQCAYSPGPSSQRLLMIIVPSGSDTPSALASARAQAAAISFSGR
jgi:hypothetical protein